MPEKSKLASLTIEDLSLAVRDPRLARASLHEGHKAYTEARSLRQWTK